MTAVKSEAFKAQVPRTAQHLLGAQHASTAVNCRLTSGDLRPYNQPLTVYTLAKPGDINALFRYQPAPDESFWLSWNEDVDAITSPVVNDLHDRIYFTAPGAAPRVTTRTLLQAGGTNYPMQSYPLGVPVPATKPAAARVDDGAHTTTPPETRHYLYTYSTSFGEEGPPSPLSDAVNVVATTTAVTVTWAAPPAGRNITTVNIYRSATGSTSEGYLLVASVAATDPSYADSVATADLGPPLSSTFFDPPPDGTTEPALTGLVTLPNGAVAGISGQYVCFSEPEYPHAWPVAYRVALSPSTPRALSVLGDTLVVLTDDYPYLLTGSHPSSMTPTRFPTPYPCLSKRGVVGSEYGVLYPSYEGLVAITGGSAEVVTRSLFTRTEWMAYNPSTFVAAIVDSIYTAFYSTGSTGGHKVGRALTVSLAESPQQFATLDLYAPAVFVDRDEGRLYLARYDGGVNKVQAHDQGAHVMTQTWQMAEALLPYPMNLAAARVDADGPPTLPEQPEWVGDGAIGGSALAAGMVASGSTATIPTTPQEATLQFTLITDGAEILTTEVTPGQVFRLPGGGKYRRVAYRITGTRVVSRVVLAGSTLECRQ